MKVLVADDEYGALNILVRAINDAVPDAQIMSFQSASHMLKEIQRTAYEPDVAFLDIEMPGITGLQLARQLKLIYPKVNIVFVTGFSSYALEAISLRSSGYVMKPATKEKVLIELENLRNPPPRSIPDKAVRVQCFGNFQVFAHGRPVEFPRAKSKEMLAYLIDRRGAVCSSAELAEVLWEDGIFDRSRQKQLQTIKADMLKGLKNVKADYIINKTANGIAVDTEQLDCDYYMALDGDIVAINSFMGEYMASYSWAEYTEAALLSKLK